MTPLHQRTHWIFDMDGTLTIAQHDFEALRLSLGLPAEQPILESLAQLSEAEAQPIRDKLHQIELELAQAAQPQPGAIALLEGLQRQGKQLAVLTRNSKSGAQAALGACNLLRFFEPACILSRDCCAPKPQPDGIHRLLKQWRAEPQQAVMVGDYVFDLLTGRNAGTATVHFDITGTFRWPDHADVKVSSLAQLLHLAGGLADCPAESP